MVVSRSSSQISIKQIIFESLTFRNTMAEINSQISINISYGWKIKNVLIH